MSAGKAGNKGHGARFPKIFAVAALAAAVLCGAGGLLHSPGTVSAASAVGTEAGSAAAGEEASGETPGREALSEEGLSVYFLDVGQGDAAFLSCSGSTMLIDGGTSKHSDFIYSWLKRHQVSELTYIVSSHPDEDHIGGLSGALHAAHAENALSPVAEDSSTGFQNFSRLLGEQGTAIQVPDAGSAFSFGDADVEVLGPVDRTAPETNNLSLVLRIVYGETSFLFTGDMEDREEADLLAGSGELRSTVLKVSHHGSANGTTYSFLRAVNPEAAVISVGRNNSYGHPSEKVMNLLNSAGISIYRTDEMGTIHAESDGTSVTFTTEKAGSAGADSPADTEGGVSADAAGSADTDSSAGADKGSVTDAGTGSEDGVSAEGGLPAAAGLAEGTAENCDYVLNVSSHKFHRPQCKSVSRMKEKNKRFVRGTRETVIADGYEPCRICNP